MNKAESPGERVTEQDIQRILDEHASDEDERLMEFYGPAERAYLAATAPAEPTITSSTSSMPL